MNAGSTWKVNVEVQGLFLFSPPSISGLDALAVLNSMIASN